MFCDLSNFLHIARMKGEVPLQHSLMIYRGGSEGGRHIFLTFRLKGGGRVGSTAIFEISSVH